MSVNAEKRDWLKVVTLRDTEFWWARKDLNLGPMDYESTALTAELRALCQRNIDILLHLVNGAGNSRSRSYCSSASSGVSCSFLRAVLQAWIVARLFACRELMIECQMCGAPGLLAHIAMSLIDSQLSVNACSQQLRFGSGKS